MTFGGGPIDGLRRALEKAGAPAWEIYYEEERELTIEVQDGEVDAWEAASSSGAGVRVIENDRIGFAYTTDFGAEAIRFAVEQARGVAAATDPEPLASLPAPDEIGTPPVIDTVDRGLRDVPRATKIDRVRALEAAARGADPRIARARKASYGEGWARSRLVSSRGLDLEEETTLVHCDVMAVAVAEEDEQLGWDARMGHFFAELDFEACGRTAAARAAALLGAEPVPTGRYAILLEPHVVCEILDVAAEWLLGESVLKKRSLLAGREGQTVAAPLLTLVDDGTHPRGAATSRWDGEGVARRRTVLFDRGVLSGFLWDRLWAAKAGRRSTGNSDRAGFRGPPGLGPSNLMIEPGEGGDLAAMCGTMGEGLRIGELIGVHTADAVSGDFSLGATGQLVRLGEPAGAVSGITIAGNLLGLFKSVQAVGSDLRFMGTTGAPSLLLEALDVAGD